MSDTLHKMRVIIEGDSSSLDRESKNAVNSTKKMVNDINSSLKNINKTKGVVDEKSTVSQIRNMTNMIKKSFSDTLSGNLFKGLAGEVKNYAKEAQLAAGVKVYSDDYQMVSKDVERAERSVDKLYAKQRDLQALGADKSSVIWPQLQKDIKSARAELEAYEAKERQLEGQMSIEGTSGDNNPEWIKLQENIERTEKKLARYEAREKEMVSSGANKEAIQWNQNCNEIARAERVLNSYRSQRSKLESSGGDVQFATGAKTGALANIGYTAQGAVSVVKQVGAAFGEVISQIPIVGKLSKSAFGLARTAAGEATTAIKKSGGAYAALIQKFASGIPILRRFTGEQKNSGNMFQGGLKTVLKYAFGIRSLYLLVNKLRSALKEGFTNLASYSSPASSAITSLQASLTALKNSFAAAFAPILTYVAPALETLINWVVAAANAVGRLFSALTGQSYAVQAVKANASTASSLGDTASAANDAADAVDNYKRSLMGFDQINKLDDNDSSSSGSGGSGGGGGSSGGGVGFTTTEIDSATKGLADAIKEAWANSDFTELGEMVGTKLKDAFDNIPWDGIKESCRKVATCIGTFINGFVETEGLAESIGSTLAEVSNTGITTLNTLIKTIHWDSVGKFISTGIQSAIQTFDFGELSNTVSSVISGALDLATGFLDGVDFKQLPKDLAKAVKDAITGFDFESVLGSAGKLVGTVIVSAIDLASGVADLVGDFVKSIKEYFVSYGVKWDSDEDLLTNGKNIVLGLLNGIKDAVTTIGSWIKTNLFQPFIDGFKSAFGIDSSSTVMQEQAGYLTDGLLEGLKNGIDSIISWFKDLPNKIKEAIGNAELKIEAAVSLVKSGWTTLAKFVGDKVSALVSLAKSGWTKIADFVGDKVNVAVYRVKKWTSTIASFVGNTVNVGVYRVKKWSGTIASFIGNKVNVGVYRVKKWTTSIKQWITGNVKGTISIGISLFKSGWSSIKKFFGLSSGGIVSHGMKFDIPQKASGGILSGAVWRNIPKFASGGDPTHGTLFVAGESGSEIVGNVNGRTEVLNKSQIASAIYSAVLSAMNQSMSAFLGSFKNMHFEMRFNADSFHSSVAENYAYSGRSNNASSDRMEAAFYSALVRFAHSNDSNNTNINVTVTISPDSKGLFRIVKTEADNYTESTGKPAFAY